MTHAEIFSAINASAEKLLSEIQSLERDYEDTCIAMRGDADKRVLVAQEECGKIGHIIGNSVRRTVGDPCGQKPTCVICGFKVL